MSPWDAPPSLTCLHSENSGGSQWATLLGSAWRNSRWGEKLVLRKTSTTGPMEKNSAVSGKILDALTLQPSNPTARMLSQRYVGEKFKMILKAIHWLIIKRVKDWKWTKCLLLENKPWCVLWMEHYAAVKRNEYDSVYCCAVHLQDTMLIQARKKYAAFYLSSKEKRVWIFTHICLFLFN